MKSVHFDSHCLGQIDRHTSLGDCESIDEPLKVVKAEYARKNELIWCLAKSQERGSWVGLDARETSSRGGRYITVDTVADNAHFYRAIQQAGYGLGSPDEEPEDTVCTRDQRQV